MAYQSRLAIQSIDEAKRVARLLSDGQITGEGRKRALADLRTFDKQQRNLANIRKDQEGYDPTSGMSGGQKFLAGIGSGMTDVALGAQQLVGLKSGEDATRKRETDAALLRTGAGMAGNIAGQVAATAPAGALGAAGRGATMLKLARAGMAQGGATGALMPATSGKERLGNVAIGAGLGAAIPSGVGMVGRLATRTPALDDMAKAMQRLQDGGIALTRADTFRNPVSKAIGRTGQDTLSGQLARAAGELRRDSTMTRAILRHIGTDADKATPEILGRARDRIGREFNEVFADDLRVPVSRDLVAEMQLIELERLPHDPHIARAVKKELANVADTFNRGPVSGKAVQGLITRLRDRSAAARRGNALEASDAYDDMVEALEEAAFEAAGPTARARLALARRQWRNLRAIEKAADRDWGGGISPRKLASYLSTNKYTKGTYSRAPKGSLELLARDLDTVSDNFPNSGTTARAAGLAEQGAVMLSVPTGGASLVPSVAHYGVQKALGSQAPRIGDRSMLRKALGRATQHPVTPPAMNAAGLIAALREAAIEDPEFMKRHLPAEVVESMRQSGGRVQGPSQSPASPDVVLAEGDLTQEELLAMLGPDAERGGEGRIERAVSNLGRIGRAPEAERAALASGFPGHREGVADRVRHRQWNSAMTREGLIPDLPVPAVGRAGQALAASTGFEAMETGQELALALSRLDFERARDKAKEGASDIRSNIAGAWNELEAKAKAKSDEDTLRRNYVGAIKQAIREGKISRKEGEELLARHGLSMADAGR